MGRKVVGIPPQFHLHAIVSYLKRVTSRTHRGSIFHKPKSGTFKKRNGKKKIVYKYKQYNKYCIIIISSSSSIQVIFLYLSILHPSQSQFTLLLSLIYASSFPPRLLFLPVKGWVVAVSPVDVFYHCGKVKCSQALREPTFLYDAGKHGAFGIHDRILPNPG
jgi:hypothetical protein